MTRLCVVISGRDHQRYLRAGDDNRPGGNHAANRRGRMARAKQPPILHRRDSDDNSRSAASSGVDLSIVRHYLLHHRTIHVYAVDYLLHLQRAQCHMGHAGEEVECCEYVCCSLSSIYSKTRL